MENNDKYTGEYKDDQLHGQGTNTSPDGTKYVGEWKNGLLDGQVKIILTNGDYCVDEYKDGEEQGEFTYFTTDGKRLKTVMPIPTIPTGFTYEMGVVISYDTAS